MKKIGEEQIHAAFDLAKLVRAEKISLKEAKKSLVNKYAMNENSAVDYINTLKPMLEGKIYTRTLSQAGTEIYLSRIQSEFGVDSLSFALEAVRRHLVYYAEKGNSKLPGTQAIYDEYLSELSKAVDHGEWHYFLERQANLAAKDKSSERVERLAGARKTPAVVQVTSSVYVRNPDVVAETLARANGLCEFCNAPAPFRRKKDNTPYLEVHHKVRLADGGEDTVSNAVALCPNCHREAHYG